MEKFLTVSAPIGRTTPIGSQDGSDPAGTLLLVTSSRVCRVRYSGETRRALAAGDLFPVKLTESIDRNGVASYHAERVDVEVDDLEADAMQDDGTHPKIKARQFKPCALREAWSPKPLANGDRVDFADDVLADGDAQDPVRVDEKFDQSVADMKVGGAATITTIPAGAPSGDVDPTTTKGA